MVFDRLQVFPFLFSALVLPAGTRTGLWPCPPQSPGVSHIFPGAFVTVTSRQHLETSATSSEKWWVRIAQNFAPWEKSGLTFERIGRQKVSEQLLEILWIFSVYYIASSILTRALLAR